MGMRFGTWNIRSLYRADLLQTIVRKMEKCNLDLLAVREVRWIETRRRLYNFSRKLDC